MNLQRTEVGTRIRGMPGPVYGKHEKYAIISSMALAATTQRANVSCHDDHYLYQ